jgi:hypothetical protein
MVFVFECCLGFFVNWLVVRIGLSSGGAGAYVHGDDTDWYLDLYLDLADIDEDRVCTDVLHLMSLLSDTDRLCMEQLLELECTTG